ncbi:Similar to alpha-Man-IIa: Alpha-mannosidase 2 (Drosophila melanogaster) [Cotesia congregata]|uniref:Similar to alpha-Man-IIa: Alpha-mannosidase 2 (Drosophila melanogaster) n=1 Tax=Cotesia congregata TaxID=51543 RepID=A0A8J2H9J0_COTCN|nr:Similar to alpha-Man-IIa: Alpha-mannosidase 2 (Drosophila melanogaster) [Cotesia congregata]
MDEARQWHSLFQHHDGVTGTARDSVVVDYAKKMIAALDYLGDITQKSAANLLSSILKAEKSEKNLLKPILKAEKSEKDLLSLNITQKSAANLLNRILKPEKS